jgi:NADH/NAD ratio-sensing transcriptional regulator Rex
MNELLGTGVESLYLYDDFNDVEIRNNRGEIIGVENIRKLVKKHEIGVVCVEKGRSQKYVDYSMNMGDKVLCTFIPDYYGNECYLFFEEEEEDGMYD